MTNALYEESEMKRVYCIVVVISALLVLCTGCGSPSIQDAGSAILLSCSSELTEHYGVTEDDFGIQSIHYGCFTGEDQEALVAFMVTDPAKYQAMADWPETFVAFCVYDAQLRQQKTQVFSLLADEITYNIVQPYGAEKDYLYINAIDIAAGAEEFVGGLYDATDWKNVLPVEVELASDFMPLILGEHIYADSIAGGDLERWRFIYWSEGAFHISKPD